MVRLADHGTLNHRQHPFLSANRFFVLERIIEASARNAFLVIVLARLFGAIAGIWALTKTPLDAIPDLSDAQVIVYTDWEGRSPDLIEDQITYPISSKFIAAPKVKFVRGESMFGKSFVYVIFEDGTDIYWARSHARHPKYLNSVRGSLARKASIPVIGPGRDRRRLGLRICAGGQKPRKALIWRSCVPFQDWHLRYALESVKGVAEVASVGGFVKEDAQVDLDPNKLLAYGISDQRRNRLTRSAPPTWRRVGGKIFEAASTEYYVRGRGYIKSIEDIEDIPLKTRKGTSVLIKNIGKVHLGPDLRRGVAELNGEGEVVGGIVVMRYGENALHVIEGVKKKLAEIKTSLPAGVEVVPTYDRSELINRSIATLREKLIEESIVVALVCLVFLWHVRSALVAIITLPVAILLSFLPMFGLHLTSNIMSLGGIAIAIGAMVDSAIIMVENAHKFLERFSGREWAQATDQYCRARGSHHCRRKERGPSVVLRAARHHRKLHSGFFARGAGRQIVPATGLHQNFLDVLCGLARRDACPRADAALRSRQDHAGDQESGESPSYLAVSSLREFCAAVPMADADRRVAGHGGERLSPSKNSARNSCRRSTKATFFSCPPLFPGSPSRRQQKFCKSRTGCCESFPKWKAFSERPEQAETPTRSRAALHD